MGELARRRPGRRRSPPPALLFLGAIVVLVLAGAYIAFALARTLPAPSLTTVAFEPAVPGGPPKLAWPRTGEAAVAVAGTGLLGTHGGGRPVPIASVTKIMTAYLVLSDHPLRGDASGPILTVSAADAATERRDAADGQSVLPVRAGERLSERQALEGLLLPSGNNIAALLAAWDAGSERAFVGRMNARARALRLNGTRYTGPSGVSPRTVSTPADQLRLAELTFSLPAFRQIVGMSQVTLPFAGRQFNVDRLLGTDGIVGIKTGSTLQAGGCFVFAARVRVHGHAALVVGAVLGQPPTRAHPSLLGAAFQATLTLLRSIPGQLQDRAIVRRGGELAALKAPWSRTVAIDAGRTVRVVGWGGLRESVQIPPERVLTRPVRAGQVVGAAFVTVGARRFTVPLVAASALGGASLGWRLRNP